MGFIRFLFREGSPIIFSIFIVLFAIESITLKFMPFLAIPDGYIGMFIVSVVSLGYLSIQMSLSAFAKVGYDGPLLDLFLSLIPLITLIIIAVLGFVGKIPLTQFQMFGFGIAAIVVAMDIVFNTMILFKMNRLANDFVQMS